MRIVIERDNPPLNDVVPLFIRGMHITYLYQRDPDFTPSAAELKQFAEIQRIACEVAQTMRLRYINRKGSRWTKPMSWQPTITTSTLLMWPCRATGSM